METPLAFSQVSDPVSPSAFAIWPILAVNARTPPPVGEK